MKKSNIFFKNKYKIYEIVLISMKVFHIYKNLNL